MQNKHCQPPAHYNQTTAVVTQPVGHPTAAIVSQGSIPPFVPGYVPAHYAPQRFFPGPSAAPHVHGHAPTTVHSHAPTTVHSHAPVYSPTSRF